MTLEQKWMCLTPAEVKPALKGYSQVEAAQAGDPEPAVGCDFEIKSAEFMKQ